MTNDKALVQSGGVSATVLEQVIAAGDIEKLSAGDRVAYYKAVCDSLGLNPLTRPFEYIRLNNKLTLYARREGTDQLRAKHGVTIEITGRDKFDDVYVVTAKAKDASGRVDESTGAVSVAGLRGEALANAFMKAETKAKRRVTLSIVGLGWLDETEFETIPGAVIESQPVAESENFAEDPNLAQRRFWAGASELLGLKGKALETAVYETLGVESIKEQWIGERGGTWDSALEYLRAQQEAEESPEPEPEQASLV